MPLNTAVRTLHFVCVWKEGLYLWIPTAPTTTLDYRSYLFLRSSMLTLPDYPCKIGTQQMRITKIPVIVSFQSNLSCSLLNHTKIRITNITAK